MTLPSSMTVNCTMGQDLESRWIPLRGTEENGLYQFSSVSPKHALTVENTAADEVCQNSSPDYRFTRWHQRLGHPSFAVIKEVLVSCNVSIPTNKSPSLCNACVLGN